MLRDLSPNNSIDDAANKQCAKRHMKNYEATNFQIALINHCVEFELNPRDYLMIFADLFSKSKIRLNQSQKKLVAKLFASNFRTYIFACNEQVCSMFENLKDLTLLSFIMKYMIVNFREQPETIVKFILLLWDSNIPTFLTSDSIQQWVQLIDSASESEFFCMIPPELLDFILKKLHKFHPNQESHINLLYKLLIAKYMDKNLTDYANIYSQEYLSYANSCDYGYRHAELQLCIFQLLAFMNASKFEKFAFLLNYCSIDYVEEIKSSQFAKIVMNFFSIVLSLVCNSNRSQTLELSFKEFIDSNLKYINDVITNYDASSMNITENSFLKDSCIMLDIPSIHRNASIKKLIEFANQDNFCYRAHYIIEILLCKIISDILTNTSLDDVHDRLEAICNTEFNSKLILYLRDFALIVYEYKMKGSHEKFISKICLLQNNLNKDNLLNFKNGLEKLKNN
ncbi:MAG: hypothetical protein MHMPM18_000933 [Marteilia pararefringens]